MPLADVQKMKMAAINKIISKLKAVNVKMQNTPYSTRSFIMDYIKVLDHVVYYFILNLTRGRYLNDTCPTVQVSST